MKLLYIYTSILIVSATFSFADTKTSHDANGGVAGGGPIETHEQGEHGKNCISEIDRANIKRGIERFVQEFGPLSAPSERGIPAHFPIYPLGGVQGEDLYTTGFVDLDEGSGFSDWNCGIHTYDGHFGSDALIVTFDHQLIGVPVVSVLDGTVVATHDGEPDQNIEWLGQPANYVIIDHGQGRVCKYLHLKTWSVVVTPGQQVKAGEEIGLVGSSGNSDWPHLHFETLDDDVVIEPYTGSCNPGESQWVDQDIVFTDTQCWDFGVTLENLDDFYANSSTRWRPTVDGYIPLNHDYVWMWSHGRNLPAWSTCRFRFYNPSGNLYYDSDWFWINFSPATDILWFRYFYWDLTGLHTTPGTWNVEMTVNGDPYIQFPLEVVAPFEQTPNRAPQPILAVIQPATPTAQDILTCRLYTAGPLDDLDWDLVRYHYTWSIGGRIVRDTISAGQADHLPRLEGCDGAVVECTVVPSDGITDGIPNTVTVRLAGVSNGDANCDGTFDVHDILILLGNWGSCGVCAGDFDGDGEVDVHDILILIANWS